MAGQQALTLHVRRAPDCDDLGEVPFPSGFVKQRDGAEQRRLIQTSQPLNLGAHQWMNQGVKPSQLRGSVKDTGGHGRARDFTVCSQNPRSPASHHRIVCGLPRKVQRVRDLVRISHTCARFRKKAHQSGFSRADAASDSDTVSHCGQLEMLLVERPEKTRAWHLPAGLRRSGPPSAHPTPAHHLVFTCAGHRIYAP